MPRPISKKGLKKKLDGLWSELVKREAGNKCEICGETQYLNAHHHIGRRNRRLRWELYNGFCLCSGCHVFRTLSAHQDPEWFRDWLEENRGEDLKLINTTKNEAKKWTMDEMMELREDFEEELS